MLVLLLRTYLRTYAGPLWLVVGLQLVGTMASLYLPSLNADIIDKGIATGDTGYIIEMGGWMLVVTVLQIACSIGAVYFGSRTAMAFGRDLRAGIFHRVGGFSAREINRFGAPSLITRDTNDVQQIQMLVLMSCTMLVAAPIMCIGGVIMALREDPGLSWLMAVCVPVLVVAISLIIVRMVPKFRLLQTRIDQINRVLREQITGIRVVRAFVREPLESRRFGTANTEVTDVATSAGRLQAGIFPVVMFVLNASSVAVLWFGSARIEAGEMQVGALTAFLAYLVQILMAVMMATFMAIMIPRAAVCADRIGEVLDTDSSVAPPSALVVPQTRAGAVEFDRVTFCYPGAASPVLPTIATVSPGRASKVTSAAPAPARPPWSRRFRACSTSPEGRSGSTGSTCGIWIPRSCGAASGWCRSGPTCSAEQWRRTCATGGPTPPTRSCGPRWRWRRPPTSSVPCPMGSTRGSPRAARTSPGGSASAWRSPGRWSSNPGSTCSTTRSRPWTSPPTPACGRRCGPTRRRPPW
jgi:ATP-binding cassette subfamily B protein